MDYRHTEDFARQMEAAALRAHDLRGEAISIFWTGVWHALRHASRALAGLLARRRRNAEPVIPAQAGTRGLT
jgi:hypothetical protein